MWGKNEKDFDLIRQTSSDKEMLAVFCVDWKESKKLHRRSDCLYSVWERDVALTDMFSS